MRQGTLTPRERVLVCDADARSVRALRIILRDAGFEVLQAGSVEEALDAAALRPPAAAILELALPDADGVDLCRQLREWSAIPLIVLSAIDDEYHKVRALNAGADDYVTKPFAPRELVARVRARLRRAQGDTRGQRIEVEGGLAIDFARRAVHRDGREVHLTPIEFSLLSVPHPHAARRRVSLRGNPAARGGDPGASPVAGTRSGPSSRLAGVDPDRPPHLVFRARQAWTPTGRAGWTNRRPRRRLARR